MISEHYINSIMKKDYIGVYNICDKHKYIYELSSVDSFEPVFLSII